MRSRCLPGALLTYRVPSLQASEKLESEWVRHCSAMYAGSVWTKCNSWYNQTLSNTSESEDSTDGYVGRFADYMVGWLRAHTGR